MTKEDFVNELELKVAEKLENYDRIEVMKGFDINEGGCPRLVIGKEGIPVSFSLRTEELYDDYVKNSRSFDEVLENIYAQIERGSLDEMTGFINSVGFGWDDIKEKVYPRLINTKMNEGIINDVPHRPFLDLSVVYYVKLDGLPDGASGSYIVRNQQLHEIGKTEEDLFKRSLTNMKKHPAQIFSLKEIFTETACELPLPAGEEGFPLYVLTNGEQMFGASEIINKEALDKASKQLGGDFILIPSSVHETLLLPKKHALDYGEVAKMVREVNDSVVGRRDRLSYHVYEYGEDTGELRMVA